MAKLFLTKNVEFITGFLSNNSPFIVQRDQKGQFYTRRIYPYTGRFDASHWELFEHLLKLIDSKIYLSDFEVSVDELAEALSDKYACPFLPSQIKKWTQKERLNAAQFREFNAWLKERFGEL